MPKTLKRGKAPRKPSPKPRRKSTRTTPRKASPKAEKIPLLRASDFRSYLNEKAMLMAPGDVQTVLDQADEARRQARNDGENHPLLPRQVDLALRLLEDHDTGECPQVPYYSVALLAVAVLYLLDPVDVIPDWIPGIGTSDDALVFELALELGAAGVERYCTWKGIPTDGLFVKR